MVWMVLLRVRNGLQLEAVNLAGVLIPLTFGLLGHGPLSNIAAIRELTAMLFNEP
jgi:hypothetical protein